MKCNRPPKGWWCSRGLGHAGPCAARQTWLNWLASFFVKTPDAGMDDTKDFTVTFLYCPYCGRETMI